MTTRVRFFLQILYCNCLDSIVAGDICAWKFCPDICLNTAACLDREHIRECIILHWRHHQPGAGAARRKTSWRVRTRNTFNRFTCRKATVSYPIFACVCMDALVVTSCTTCSCCVDRPVVKEIYYLLADYYFKNKEQGYGHLLCLTYYVRTQCDVNYCRAHVRITVVTQLCNTCLDFSCLVAITHTPCHFPCAFVVHSKAIKFYIHDLCVNPARFDAWAGMALARSSRLEQRLNSVSAPAAATCRNRMSSAHSCR